MIAATAGTEVTPMVRVPWNVHWLVKPVLDAGALGVMFPLVATAQDVERAVSSMYYPPRGDNKEGWDAVDIFGWMGYPMQIKIDFLCRDSILAAPIVLDLALFMDLAHRAGESGVQEWLSFYLKAPQAAGDNPAEQDLFIQQTKLKNTLREWMGELPVTHSEAG